jgi:hypothetical protein
MRVCLRENGQSESPNKTGYVYFSSYCLRTIVLNFLFQTWCHQRHWQVYLRSTKERSPSSTTFSRSGSGYASPVGNMSGYQTPREIKEERWKLESDAISQPGKLEMREMHKELGGRKARTKTKLGTTCIRDKGGWDDGGESW